MIRKIAGIASLLYVAHSFAFGQGIYAGVNGGWAWPSKPTVGASTSTKNKNYTLGGQLGYNYQLNQNWLIGAEAGYRNFGRVEYEPSVATLKDFDWQPYATLTYVLGESGFDIYGKAGYARETSELSYDGTSNQTTAGAWVPSLAAGVGYSFLDHFNFFGEWQHNFGKRGSNALTESKPIALDAATLGISYIFPM
jgi:outer membrane immunogenic protein